MASGSSNSIQPAVRSRCGWSATQPRSTNRGRTLLLRALFGILFTVAFSAAAERFGDITVTAQSLASGKTEHGYREVRVLIVNHSVADPHQVGLVFPDKPYGYGNSISRVSRTVTVGPGARLIVPLWQPPLPAEGAGQLRGVVDGERPEIIDMPSAVQHITQGGRRYGGANNAAAILVSRSLNFDELTRALKAQQNTFSAGMAVGAPNSGGRRGMVSTAWMPDQSVSGPHWLELTFDTPIRPDRISIYETMGTPLTGEILLTGVSGTNVGRILLSGARAQPFRGSVRPLEYPVPMVPEPVKTVRLSFGNTYAGSISVDALELRDGQNAVFAASAKASSEAPQNSLPPGMPGGDHRELLRSEVSVSDWSEYWLSYTPYDAVALTGNELRTMPPAVRETLWRYAESGGNIFLFGGGDVPETWRADRSASPETGRCFNAGFGQCFVFQSENIASLGSAAAKVLTDSVSATAREWGQLPDENAANASFPVIENVQVPIRGIVFIMLLFVIIIGPVNIIYLTRKNKRTWLLWTIPAISFVTCLLVFVYSLAREGVTPDVRIAGLTFLDQGTRRASTIGATAFYCPLTPSQGLFFGSDTEATPLVETWNYRGGTRREMDWTQSQHLQRGWVTARVPAHFRLRKSETRRERLQLDNENGRLTVINGLGAGIRTLWLADAGGRIYSTTNIAAGEKKSLAPLASFPKVTSESGVQSFFRQNGFDQPSGFLFTNAPASLLPNTYIAELESNPFLENGLGSKAKSARVRSEAKVYGILETTRQP